MFKSRQKPTKAQKLKAAIWPTMSLKRTLTYWKLRIIRLLRTEGLNRLSNGIACGIAASFFPVVGTQFFLAAGMAYIARLPIPAALIGTILVLPVFLPFLFMLDFLVGRRLLQELGFHGWGTEAHFERETSDYDPTWWIDDLETLFLPAIVGFIIFLPIIWAASYMAVRSILSWLLPQYQDNKK